MSSFFGFVADRDLFNHVLQHLKRKTTDFSSVGRRFEILPGAQIPSNSYLFLVSSSSKSRHELNLTSMPALLNHWLFASTSMIR